jgi:hypothetical protein
MPREAKTHSVAKSLNQSIESSATVLKSFNEVHGKRSPAGSGVGSGVHVKAKTMDHSSQDRS